MPQRIAFTVFPTPIGDCALAWNGVGLTGVWLPEASPERLRSRIRRRHADAVEATHETAPPASLQAIADITRLLEGRRLGLAGIRLDESAIEPFDRRVYAAARAIPAGRVITYGALAERVGGAASARAVGQSLGRNPFPIVVPCHRIVASSGELGGFSAPGGSVTKQRLLRIEDARLEGPGDLFDDAGADGMSAAGR